MPNEIVLHGAVTLPPQPGLSGPAPATNTPRAMSPSMPSQLSSLYMPSGSSVCDGAMHAPQPIVPPHVRAPAQLVPSVVVIVHASVAPMSSAVMQSHARDCGTHCL